MKALKLFKSLKKYLKNDKKNLCLLSLVTIISVVSKLLYASLWGFILQYLMNKKFFEAILFLVLNLAFSIWCTLFNSYRDYLEAKITKSSIQDLQVELFHKSLDFPAVAYEEKTVGEISNRIFDDTKQIVNNFVKFIKLISYFIMIFIIIIIFININKILAGEVILYTLVAFFITRYFAPKIKSAGQKEKDEHDVLSKNTTQVLSGIREVKALGIKQRIGVILGTRIKGLFTYHYDNQMISIYHYLVEWLVYFICEFIVLFTGAFMFYKEIIVISVIVLIYNYLRLINYAIEMYGEFMPNYQQLVISLERLDEFSNNKLYKPEEFGTTHLKEVTGNIKFNKVSLIYPHDTNPTLNNITFDIKTNKKIAIVGTSGSGKTSIFNLLLHYFKPTSGEILIDDVNILDLDEETIRTNIGIIRQDTFLFKASIMDNFRMVKENVTLEEVRKVCKATYIDSYIMKLPNGYDTIIGEHGINLSGGQKQQLSIARSLLKNSKIILFDEPVSNLDNKSQTYIKKTIDKLALNHTVIIIAHRLSTIIDADEIILISDGNVVATGTHKKLMKNKTYKELYKPDIIN